MCVVFKEDFEKILNVLVLYLKDKDFDVVENKDELKDYLADLKESKEIIACGCKGMFELKNEGDTIVVYMEILNNMYKFVVGDEPSYKFVTYAEAIPNYDEITENNNFN